MVERSEQALRLLLPRATPPQMRRARSLTTFLRLLSNDAQAVYSRSVPITLERARAELAHLAANSGREALVELFRQHLAAATPAEGFAWCGAVGREPQRAWSALEALRSEFPDLPEVPAPGEPAFAVARRLRAGLERLGAAPSLLELWDAYLERASDPLGAAQLFRTLARRRALPSAVRRATVVAVAEGLLDRGAVRAARTWLEEQAPADPARAGVRERWLLVWARLLESGEPPVEDVPEPWPERLPLPLLELRQRVPDWMPWLSGRAGDAPAPGGAGRGSAPIGDARSRGAFGASFLAVFALRAGESAEPVLLDAAPGLRPCLADWSGASRGAAGTESELEHRAVVEGAPQFVHRRGASPIEGCLAAESARAVAVAPIIAPEGDVRGWLRIECEHHLLPSRARLARVTDAWARDPALRPTAVPEPRRSVVTHPPGPCAEVFAALVAGLAMKTRERRWWGFAVEGAHTVCVAEGGEGLAQSHEPGNGKALERARAARGVVMYDGTDARLPLHPRAAGGLVVPLCARGRLVGLFAVESERRRDFRPADVERIRRAAQRGAGALAIARFRTWHMREFGRDLHFEEDGVDPWWSGALAFASSPRPVLILGPPGSGKRTLSRWLHFQGPRRRGPWIAHTCDEGRDHADRLDLAAEESSRDRLWQRAAGGTLVLHRVERLAPALQVRLAARLDAAESRPGDSALGVRLIATASCASSGGTTLAAELQRRLERLGLRVPSLARRRAEVPALIRIFTIRAADEERLARPSWTAEALACLWRQHWDDNLRALEGFVHRAVLLAAGRDVGLDVVRAAAASLDRELARRLPSRHPDRRDLRAALDSTRTRGGRWNKTRAAALLGWDPDTLAARLREVGLQDEPAAD